ncbi:MAG: HAMP domain-containing histidine kinase [Paenibacillus sp.]|nr:HAMP domain-containing histidine kinase [Paenibacillus sp.]
MSRNIYDIRRYGIIIFMVMSMAVVGVFLYYSDSLVRDLSQQERARMEIWANATREIVKSAGNESSQAGSSTMDFLMSIIENNRNIPVLLTDGEGNIMMHRNFRLPEPPDPTAPLFISERNEKYLRAKLDKMVLTPNVIEIDMGQGERQYLYYEDSRLLKALNYYPYIQIIVLIVFISIVYFAVSSTKRAEQNKIWLGLSKETAHQLGTPISSLMAWTELLENEGISREITTEMDKDLKRLSTIASRFSKIGSRPTMEPYDLNTAVTNATEYMSTRISQRIRLTIISSDMLLPVKLSAPLIEWVIENLIKNSVDATVGSGVISIKTYQDGDNAVVDITDTGKGISKKMQRNIFNPGFTIKERGWGLGLTLARRIVEEYHDGHIFIKRSELGSGTTFTIEIPLIKENPQQQSKQSI